MTIHYKNWDEVPTNLATKTTLGREGFKPGENIAGTIFQRSTRSYLNLYDRNEAIPKKKMTEKQQLALEKAREKSIQQRTCTRCEHTIQHKNKLENGLCSTCIKNLAEIQQIEEQRESCVKLINNYFLNKNDYVILDTQTTGLGENDEIVEIAVIDMIGKTLLHTLVKPTIPIPDNITMIHGITNKMTVGGRNWNTVYSELLHIIANKTLLIYNAKFDVSMLQQTCFAHNISPINVKSECMMELYATYMDSKNHYSLEEATDSKIPRRALDRCLALLLLMQQIQ
ncbi:TPA: 3'-5' exonuclease [Bacillus thuringiensis]|nr:3'-5' exonuclease [Bacillus thuringiensis]